MTGLTIIFRENTVTLKQMFLPNGKIRFQVTIPKHNILFWLRDYMAQENPAGVYVSQEIADTGGKLFVFGMKDGDFIRVTAAELDALNEGF